MDCIVEALSADKRLGFDQHQQLWCWTPSSGGGMSGRIVKDMRDKACLICGHGWDLTAESYSDQWHWQIHEEVVHETCMIRYVSLQDYALYWNALRDAGFRWETPARIKNEYWSPRDRWHARPWYRVSLLDSKRTLKLGFRKNVHHLEIERGEGEIDAKLAIELFRTENVTKGLKDLDINSPKDWTPHMNRDGWYVHAWSNEKVKEYIMYFASVLGLEKKKP